MVISDNDVASSEIVVPLGYCIVYSKSFLFGSAPFALHFRKGAG